jgi:hypothetical protein
MYFFRLFFDRDRKLGKFRKLLDLMNVSNSSFGSNKSFTSETKLEKSFLICFADSLNGNILDLLSGNLQINEISGMVFKMLK